MVLMLLSYTIYFYKTCHIGNIINIESGDNDIILDTYSFA